MNQVRTICAVTGSRADYGLLVSPLKAIRADPAFRLELVLTGQHLTESAGNTAECVRQDGFDIAAAVDMALCGDDAVDITKAAARALDGIADVLARMSPDLVLVLGDRYEILCCALAATLARTPIAHVAGGDLTEGAFDDSFRHAITKMAHLHFVTNPDAARRVRQLGERSDRVHVVGSPGLDLIAETAIPSREAFFAFVGLVPKPVNFLVTFHPVTRTKSSLEQFAELLAALSNFNDAAIIFTGSNADPEGRRIDALAQGFAATHDAARFIPSLGTVNYFAALSHSDVVIGNSSSGLYEAPSFGVPTVNIGDRQKGRLKADSVFDCGPERTQIKATVELAISRGRRPTANPYGDGHAGERIARILKSIDDPQQLLVKGFVDLAVR